MFPNTDLTKKAKWNFAKQSELAKKQKTESEKVNKTYKS